jgi:nucleoside-diphosphate-sugar epimerase
MRLLILGSTGPTGILLIRQALADLPSGSTISLFVRNPDKIPSDLASNPSITVHVGQLTGLASLEKSFEGVDAVVSALGPRGSHPSGTPIAIAFKHIIDLMHKHGVKRLLTLATASIPDTQDKFNFVYSAMVWTVSLLVRNAYKDIVAIGETIKTYGGDLDWTIVRVPLLTDAEKTDVIAGYVGDGKTTAKLSRSGFAKFAIGELEKREWVQKAPILCSA